MTQPSPKTKALKEKLTSLKYQEEKKRAKDLAEKLNLPYLNLALTPIETESINLLPEEKARKAKIVIIQKRAKHILAAAKNPEDASTKDILSELKKDGYKIKLFIAALSDLEKAWKSYEKIISAAGKITGKIEITAASLAKLQKEIKSLTDVKNKIQNIPIAQASNTVEVLLGGSLGLDASDIHLETAEDRVNFRYRIDGLLQDVVFLSHKNYHFILNRIKLLAGLKLNVYDAAQDGHFTISLDKTDIEIRVSCLPSAYGENIVMRVLNPKMIGLELENLGFRPEILEIVKKEIKKTNGLIITTGPTGSGKTTALYAFLKKINKPDIKIITMEDPIEYRLMGITQTQVKKESGYSFAQGLRAILRQDPDVILVGEIRDKETAETTLQASLTGHLVFSTLHTNDAAGAIPRFIELGAKAPILASGLTLVLAQRLIRKLCLGCRQIITPSAEQIAQIKKNLPFQQTGLIGQKIEIKKIYRARACPECNQTGYKGRIGAFEIILINEEMEKLISLSPSHSQILDWMKKEGLLTMHQDALLKALEGITSLEEVERVTPANL